VQIASKRPGHNDSVEVLERHLSFLKMIDPARFQSLRAGGFRPSDHPAAELNLPADEQDGETPT
jgi:hypothetical protein